jgi:hypothetical protein
MLLNSGLTGMFVVVVLEVVVVDGSLDEGIGTIVEHAGGFAFVMLMIPRTEQCVASAHVSRER